MAIAKVKPTASTNTELNTPKVDPDSYKTTSVIRSGQEINTLLAYVAGSQWSVEYFSQLVTKDNDLKEVDIGLDSVYQQYSKINGYVLKVSSDISTSYDSENAITTVEGSGTVFGFIIPNINDYFLAEAGLNNKAIFQVVDVIRKSFNLESVYSIDYKLIDFIDSTEGKQLYDNIVEKTSKEYWYDHKRFTRGLNPIVMSEEKRDIEYFSSAIKNIIVNYFNSFLSKQYSNLVLPGQTNSLYDFFVVDFLLKIVEVSEYSGLKNLRTIPNANDPRLSSTTLWDMVLNRDVSLFPYVVKNTGIVSKELYNPNTYLQGLKYTPVDYVIYPRDDSDKSYSLDDSLKIGEIGNDKPSFDLTLSEGTNSLGILASELVGEYETTDGLKRLVHPVTVDTYYVLSVNFYENGPDKSILEILVRDHINKNTIDVKMLGALVDFYPKMGRLEQFYYGPLILALLKEYVSSL